MTGTKSTISSSCRFPVVFQLHNIWNNGGHFEGWTISAAAQSNEIICYLSYTITAYHLTNYKLKSSIEIVQTFII